MWIIKDCLSLFSSYLCVSPTPHCDSSIVILHLCCKILLLLLLLSLLLLLTYNYKITKHGHKNTSYYIFLKYLICFILFDSGILQ